MLLSPTSRTSTRNLRSGGWTSRPKPLQFEPVMREKDYNTGLRGVLFEAQHHARMGSAIWLYGWLVLRQTHQTGTTGWVLGGAPITYREIEEETGFNRRTLERWMSVLRRNDYISTESAPGGVIVRILKAKKHLRSAISTHPVRKVAEGVRKDAGQGPQNCGATGRDVVANQMFAGGIGSSSVVRIKERIERREIHTPVEKSRFSTAPRENRNIRHHDPTSQEVDDCERIAFRKQFEKLLHKDDPKPAPVEQTKSTTTKQHLLFLPTHDQHQPQTQRPLKRPSPRPPTQQSFPWELRARMRLLRAERDEEVRRELAVGTGPEVRHP
jgi:hypothetical protein